MEWQPIETAPRDGTEVLIYDHGIYLARWSEQAELGHFETGPAWQIWPSEDDEFYAVATTTATHWMPLPPSPKGEE